MHDYLLHIINIANYGMILFSVFVTLRSFRYPMQ